MKIILNNIKKDDKFIFYIVSIVFAIAMSNAGMYGDDVEGNSMAIGTASVLNCLQKSIISYTTWSSRIIINPEFPHLSGST